jgi:hypothetical protein
MLRSTFSGLLLTVLVLAGCSDLPTAIDDRVLGCDRVRSHSIGTSVSGSLDRSDCQLADGAAVDYYRFQLGSARSVRVTMTSSIVDTYVVILDRDGYLVAEEDDGGAGFSRLTAHLAAGTYYIAATSYRPGDYGEYRLTSEYR